MNSKKWLKIWFIIIIIIPIIGAFNYYIDSLGILKKNSYLDDAAKDLVRGNIIAGLQNCDERIFRKRIITNLDRKIEWVAIGSSRIMQLRERMFLSEKGKFQNYSVSGASLEDYLALLQVHYNKFNSFPKNIILGIDPWIFNKNNRQNRFMSLYAEYSQFLDNIGINIQKNKENNIKKIFSLEYTKENILFIKNNISTNLKGYYLVDTINTDDYLREPDGSIQYKFKTRNPNFEVVKKKALSYASGNVYSIENFSVLSYKKIFDKFIEFLIHKKIKIYFYLPPYNPYTYDILMDRKYYVVNEVEKYLNKFAKEHNIKVIGSYNPHRLGLRNKNFFDGMHALDNVYEILFKNIEK